LTATRRIARPTSSILATAKRVGGNGTAGGVCGVGSTDAPPRARRHGLSSAIANRAACAGGAASPAHSRSNATRPAPRVHAVSASRPTTTPTSPSCHRRSTRLRRSGHKLQHLAGYQVADRDRATPGTFRPSTPSLAHQFSDSAESRRFRLHPSKLGLERQLLRMCWRAITKSHSRCGVASTAIWSTPTSRWGVLHPHFRSRVRQQHTQGGQRRAVNLQPLASSENFSERGLTSCTHH